MQSQNNLENLPEPARFSAEEKIQLLSGDCPRNITKDRLKEWLSFRKGTAKDGSARSDATKAELAQRVVSYIKNGWEDNFTDKYIATTTTQSTTNDVTITASSRSAEFPGSAEWVPLKDAQKDVPAFNMQNIISYFIERKANDNVANNDYKNVSSKAFGLFRHGHIQTLELALDNDKVHFRCNCLPEMKKTMKYSVKLSLVKNGERGGDIVFASCPCPAGKGPQGSCKHIAGLCYALEEFSRLKCTREFDTCTSRLQSWNQPRKRKLEPQTVYDIDFSRKIYGREERNIAKHLNDPRHPSDRNNDQENANKELLDKIKKVRPNSGFFCLLSDEKLNAKQSGIISPIKEHPVNLTEILDRAERVKRNLMVDEQERRNIALATKSQSNCQEWFHHRRVRITASQCKRAILKPSTSPTKALRDILQYNKRFQSKMMMQGLEDEKKILSLYENQVGCKVNDTGFLISQSHPFLGASPDGEVDGGLVEIKRIFSGDLTLKEAVCKRRICKKCDHGLAINKKHKFYFQVQQQMFCAGLNWTDLVLSNIDDLIILHIKKSNGFLSNNIPKLEEFYDKHISLELAYPRVSHGLPRLSKLITRDI